MITCSQRNTRSLDENETTGEINSHFILNFIILSLPLILPTIEVHIWVSSTNWGFSEIPSIKISLVSPGLSSTRKGVILKIAGGRFLKSKLN